MSVAIAYHDIEVPAGIGLARLMDTSGELFVCKEATAQFEMQFDDGPKFKCEGGFSIRPPGGFTKLTFFNLLSVALLVSFYAGNAYVSYDYLRTPRTRTKAKSDALVLGGTQNFLGTDSGNRRKEIVVTNRHATDELQLRDPATLLTLLSIWPKTVERLETDADLQLIYGGPGAILNYAVAEIFYLT